jgi:homoserine kinase
MISASAPASSANLGPGYDVVALALAIRCSVALEPAARWEVISASPGGEALVQAAADAVDPGCGPLRVVISGSVPVARGLGSSAALIVATMAATGALSGTDLGPGDLVGRATDVEGHPDNVAAAVHGGLVAVGPAGTVHPLVLHPSLRVVLAVPDEPLSTEAARQATREPVSTAVAARTAARLAFLVEGLRTGDPGLLREAAGDELHEARRSDLSPGTAALVAAARQAGAVHASWSGAGPSALALVRGDADAAAVRSTWEAMLVRGGGSIYEPEIDRRGVVVERR